MYSNLIVALQVSHLIIENFNFSCFFKTVCFFICLFALLLLSF